MTIERMSALDAQSRIVGRLFRLMAALLLVLICVSCSRDRDTNTVVMLIESSPINLDPRIGTDAQSARIAELIFDSPLRRDIHSRLQPSVASSWENPDPLTYILHIRTDVKFHDGRPLRAQDIRYTLQTLMSGELKSLKTGSFTRVADVQAPDARTVVIHLKEPYASFLWNLTQGAFGILPEGSTKDVSANPMGSGPFVFRSAGSEEYVRLERNADYWAGAPQIQSVEFKVVPDATTRALELRRGSADIVVNALSADTVQSLRRQPQLAVADQPGNTYQYLGLNLQSPKLSLPVRQALAYAIDRDSLIRNLWQGLVAPADSILPPEHWAHAANLDNYNYNPQKAIELLEAAGYGPGPDGFRLTLEMKTSTDQGGRELAAVLQDQLRSVGIRLEARAYEFATFYTDITKGNFDLFSLRWIGGNEDPDIFEYVFYSTKLPPAGANRGRFKNAEADQLIDAARQTPVMEQRKAIYAQLQQLLNRQLPYIHLWYLDSVAVYNRRLLGVEIPPDGSYSFLSSVKLKEGRGTARE